MLKNYCILFSKPDVSITPPIHIKVDAFVYVW